jgi:CheY-like chemotaxis protein
MQASVTDRSVADPLLYAAHADQIPVLAAHSGNSVLRATAEERPSLIILERKDGALDPLKLCAKIRSLPTAADIPIIIVADAQELQLGMAVGVTDWLIRPFSTAYARTRIRAWLLRTTVRWERLAGVRREHGNLVGVRGIEERVVTERCACWTFVRVTSARSKYDFSRMWQPWSNANCNSGHSARSLTLGTCIGKLLRLELRVVPARLASRPQHRHYRRPSRLFRPLPLHASGESDDRKADNRYCGKVRALSAFTIISR